MRIVLDHVGCSTLEWRQSSDQLGLRKPRAAFESVNWTDQVIRSTFVRVENLFFVTLMVDGWKLNLRLGGMLNSFARVMWGQRQLELFSVYIFLRMLQS